MTSPMTTATRRKPTIPPIVPPVRALCEGLDAEEEEEEAGGGEKALVVAVGGDEVGVGTTAIVEAEMLQMFTVADILDRLAK